MEWVWAYLAIVATALAPATIARREVETHECPRCDRWEVRRTHGGLLECDRCHEVWHPSELDRDLSLSRAGLGR